MESENFKVLLRVLQLAELSSLRGGYIYDSKMKPLDSKAINRLRKSMVSGEAVTVYHLDNDNEYLVKYELASGKHTVCHRPLSASEINKLHDHTIEVLHPEIFKKKFRRISWGLDFLFSTVV